MFVLCVAGKWHKKYFINRDVVEIFNVLKAKTQHVGDIRDCFYTIVTSVCPTSTTPYKLYTKANTMVTSLRTPRKSRRNNNSSNTDDDVDVRSVLLNKRFRVPTLQRQPLQTINQNKFAAAGPQTLKANKMLKCKTPKTAYIQPQLVVCLSIFKLLTSLPGNVRTSFRVPQK